MSRMTARILDLEREMPNLPAFAFRRWQDGRKMLQASPSDPRAKTAEVDTFWDWALLELLVQSGLRIEEASELTTLNILKRSMPDGPLYYMLPVKPSKYDRARVVPIGDGLGRVLAEIIRHVRSFYCTDSVPPCDHWDHREKRPRPRAPYLLQGIRHPSPLGIQTIRSRVRDLSIKAALKRADGSPLVVVPHDCRRVFASEHLNNDTPVHVIQALLGTCHDGHRHGVREAVPAKNDRGVSESGARCVSCLPRRRQLSKAHPPGVGRVRGELPHARYGNSSLRTSDRRTLPTRPRLPGMQSCTTEEERGTDFPSDVDKP